MLRFFAFALVVIGALLLASALYLSGVAAWRLSHPVPGQQDEKPRVWRAEEPGPSFVDTPSFLEVYFLMVALLFWLPVASVVLQAGTLALPAGTAVTLSRVVGVLGVFAVGLHLYAGVTSSVIDGPLLSKVNAWSVLWAVLALAQGTGTVLVLRRGFASPLVAGSSPLLG
jgi:hypothetical protein